MKKMLLLLALIVVQWKLEFVSNVNMPAVTFDRTATFKTKQEAEQFIANAPKIWFECVESSFGQQGLCRVKEIKRK